MAGIAVREERKVNPPCKLGNSLEKNTVNAGGEIKNEPSVEQCPDKTLYCVYTGLVRLFSKKS